MHEMCGEDDYSSLPRVAGQAKSIQIQKLEGLAFVPLFFFSWILPVIRDPGYIQDYP